MNKLIVAVVTVAILGLLAGCSSPEEKAAKYIANGDQLFSESKYQKASIEYRNALQINQNLPDAWYGLARIHERKQEWKQAYGVLAKIRDTNPNHVNGRIMLAQLLLATNQIDQALKDAEHVLELAPDDPRAHSLMAAVQFRLGNFEVAQESVERSLELDPEGGEAILVKARVLISEGKYDEAINVIDSALASSPDNASLYLMKIQTYSELGDEAAVVGVLEDMTRQFPKNTAFKLALGRQYLRNDDIDGAERLLQEIVDDNPEDVTAKLRLITFKNQHRSLDESIDLVEAYIELYPKEYQFRFTLAGLYLANKDPDKAISIYEEVISDDGVQPNGLEARNKLALIRLRTGKPAEARKLIDEVLAQDQNNENALLFRAGFRIAERNFDDAIVDLRTILRDNPTSTKALGLIGQAYAATQSTELAIESYSKAFGLNPQVPAIANAYADLLIRNRDFKQADDVLQKSMAAGNQSVDALRLSTQAKLMLGEYDQAEQFAQRLQAIEGQEALSLQLLGMVYQAREQPEQSIDAFKQAHELSPNASQPVMSLVQAYMRDGQVEEARAFLQTVLSENENNVTAYLLLGQISLRENDMAGAIGYFKQVIKINPKLGTGYQNLAGIYTRTDRLEEAEDVLRAGLTELPGNVSFTISLASIFERQQQYEKAIELYEDLLQANPDLIVVKNNLASMLIDYRQDQESHDRARQLAVELRGSSIPQFRDTYAWAAVRTDTNLEEAIVVLEEIVRENEMIGVYHYHLGEAYRKNADAARAQAHLEKAIELEPAGSVVAAEAAKSLKLVSR